MKQEELILRHDDNTKDLSLFVDKFKVAEKFEKLVDKFNENFLLSKLVEESDLLEMEDINWWYFRPVDTSVIGRSDNKYWNNFKSGLLCNEYFDRSIIKGQYYLLICNILNRYYDQVKTYNHGGNSYGYKYKDITELEKDFLYEFKIKNEILRTENKYWKTVWERLPKLEISQKQHSLILSELKKISNYNKEKNFDYNFEFQSAILSVVGKDFCESLSKKYKDSINYLREYYLKNNLFLGCKREYCIGYSTFEKTNKQYYIINDYGQPLFVCNEESLKLTRIFATEDSIIVSSPIVGKYSAPIDFYRINGYTVELKFDIGTNTLSSYRIKIIGRQEWETYFNNNYQIKFKND